MKSGGDAAKSICKKLTGDARYYCEAAVEEQCIDQVPELCTGLPFGKGDTHKACVSDTDTAWAVPQSDSLAAALQNQTKWFSINIDDIPQIAAKVYKAYSLEQCVNSVFQLINIFGVPASFDPFMELDPFVTVDIAKAKKFKKTKEAAVVVIGKEGDPAAIELQRKIFKQYGDGIRLLFIPRPETPDNKFKQIMKIMGFMGKGGNYLTFDPENPEPQAFIYGNDGGKWGWSLHVTMEEAEEYVPPADSFANLPPEEKAKALYEKQKMLKMQMAMAQAEADAAKFLKLQQALKEAEAKAAELYKKQQELKKAQEGEHMDMVITEEEAEGTPPAAVPPAPAPAAAPEENIYGDPARGEVRILTAENFKKFFSQKGCPVILIVGDYELRKHEIDDIAEDQKDKPEANRAFIAVLDTRDLQTAKSLWPKIAKISQDPKGIIDKNYIKPFAVLLYKGGKIINVDNEDVDFDENGQTDLTESYYKFSIPTVPELKKVINPATMTTFNLFHLIKKGKIDTDKPVTVFVVRDPSDADFTLEAEGARQDGKGSIFYINWNNPESRMLAEHYLGIPPLADAHKYTRWEISGPDEHGYFKHVEFVSGVGMIEQDLIDAASVTSDPYKFLFVNELSYERYINSKTQLESIVVVGDPYAAKTQQLMEQIAEEKRDLRHDKQLIMIPVTSGSSSSALLKRLGMSTKIGKTPHAYSLTWNAQGNCVTKPYTSHGFEIVHEWGTSTDKPKDIFGYTGEAVYEEKRYDNTVWERTVVGSNDDVLLVIGSTDSSWDSGIAKATQELRTHLVNDISDGSVLVAGRSVTKIVYLNYSEVLKIFASELPNPQKNTIPYAFIHDNKFPQMFLIMGSKASRVGMKIMGSDISLPDGWSPDAMPGESVIIDLSKKSEASKKVEPGPEPVPTPGATAAETAKEGDSAPKLIFKEMAGTMWALENVANLMRARGIGKFILLIGNQSLSSVANKKKKLIKKLSGQNVGLFYVDSNQSGMNPSEKSNLEKLLSKIFKITIQSVSAKPAVFECTLNASSEFTCHKY
jgi:hypothetical protein